MSVKQLSIHLLPDISLKTLKQIRKLHKIGRYDIVQSWLSYLRDQNEDLLVKNHAHLQIGRFYMNGSNTEVNYQYAYTHIMHACRYNIKSAFSHLYRLCALNVQVIRDHPETYEVVLHGAEQNIIDAQLMIVNMHLTGICTEQSFDKAIEWIKKVAPVSSHGMYLLAVCHSKGYGLPADSVKAYKCAVMASNDGSERARDMIKEMDDSGVMISRKRKSDCL